ncbi:unnamed protein product, partial [Allacma fusca]
MGRVITLLIVHCFDQRLRQFQMLIIGDNQIQATSARGSARGPQGFFPHLIFKQHTPCQVARIKLPFEEVAEFEGMETSAAKDPTLKDELVRLISDNGRGAKRGVRHYSATDAVYAAVKINYPECTRSTFERTSKDWLKQAPARLKTNR